MADYKYPEDEFDRLARERKVLGAHREVRPKYGWKLAVLAVIVIVPLIAWVFVRANSVNHDDNTPAAPAPNVTEMPSGEPGAGTGDGKAGEPGASSTDGTDKKDGQVDKDLQVRVLNGSRVDGFAAKKEAELKDAGFTNTVADDYGGGSAPSSSTVYYANEEDAATAEKVASALGISEVKLSPQSVSGGQGIVVVLRSDIA